MNTKYIFWEPAFSSLQGIFVVSLSCTTYFHGITPPKLVGTAGQTAHSTPRNGLTCGADR